MSTTNFEAVLQALSTAETVCTILNQDVHAIQERYESIQRALVEAVHAVHIPWASVEKDMLLKIREALRAFQFVYSTNYDLLVYWAFMAKDNGDGFVDYFFKPERFDVTNTKVYSDQTTRIFYLHGALHLYRLPSGGTLKRRANLYENLLDLFGTPYTENAVPLFITEGTSRDKLASIYRSDYLSFAYAQFSQHEGPLVVFGHSLSESDKHLIEAMQKWEKRPIAVSMLGDEPQEVVLRKAEFRRRFPQADLIFFDAKTHPLGTPSLKINPS